MDSTRHYFLVGSCPGFMPISFVRDSKEKERALIIRDGIQGESEDTEPYPHNNKQANQQWFPQHQETLHKPIPT